jgi:hypothetical protein
VSFVKLAAVNGCHHFIVLGVLAHGIEVVVGLALVVVAGGRFLCALPIGLIEIYWRFLKIEDFNL